MLLGLTVYFLIGVLITIATLLGPKARAEYAIATTPEKLALLAAQVFLWPAVVGVFLYDIVTAR